MEEEEKEEGGRREVEQETEREQGQEQEQEQNKSTRIGTFPYHKHCGVIEAENNSASKIYSEPRGMFRTRCS